MEVTCILKLTTDQVLAFDLTSSRAHRQAKTGRQGGTIRKPVNVNLGLKINRIITFSSVYMVIIKARNRRLNYTEVKLVVHNRNRYTEGLTAKLQKSNQNSTFAWVGLIGL